jgi:hypothetical protein
MSVPARLITVIVAAVAAVSIPLTAAQDGVRFTSGVELVNITATVTGRDGRFLAGLDKDDFIVFDNGERQPITHFSSERAPVSLGILLDASGSMADDKMAAARRAIQRFVTDHLPRQQIAPAVARLLTILKPGGILYVSWRVTEGADQRDGHGRLYSAFDAGLVRVALGNATLLLDEEVTSLSSGKTIHRIVARRN